MVDRIVLSLFNLTNSTMIQADLFTGNKTMLKIYGLPVSSPSNKVRYVANYLEIPYEFTIINLAKGEQKSPEYLKLNPLGRVPAIDDDGFHLAESNAIVRYLADKNNSPLYPKDLKKRAIVDQWIDYASQHVMLALGRIMFNTYFYKLSKSEKDERSLADGRKFIESYLPVVDQQLGKLKYIADDTITLADIVMIAALDTCELSAVDLSHYAHIVSWRDKLMKEPFYQKCHESYTAAFKQLMKDRL